MSETKEPADKTLRAGAKKPLSLKRTVESGHVRQSFSHGRSNVVVVEKKRKRTISPTGGDTDDGAQAAEASQAAAPAAAAPAAVAPTAAPASAPAPATTASAAGSPAQRTPASRPPVRPSAQPSGAPRRDVAPRGRTLSSSELEARQRALSVARERAEIEARENAELEARRREEAQRLAEQRAREEAERLRQEEIAKQNGTVTAPAAAPSGTPAPAARKADAAGDARPRTDADAGEQRRGEPARRPVPAARRAVEEEDDDQRSRKPDLRGGGLKKPKIERPAPKAGDERRERQKLTITNFDREAQERSLASLRRKREREKLRAMGVQQPREKIVREVIIPEVITIQELSNRMAERGVDIIKFLMKQGEMHKINDVIDADTAELIVTEFGHKVKRVSESDVEEGFIGARDEDENLRSRAPVVTIMGHVDHGKTSLLDAIRKTSVASGEAGGITQHIGAYQVTMADGNKITFIDTPGHEAFTAMRARGAKVTDIVILVVAADDGVMPQTVEAINHAKAANVPIIVAINKIDKHDADPTRVRTELLQHEIVVESMSGEVLDVPVSAIKGTGLDKLLEAILLQSEILDLKANPERSAEGFVIEAKLERGRGPVGTLLVQRGTLSVGDIVVAGGSWGRVRALIDDQGKNLAKAGPSVPVEVLGFDSAPEAGDQFAVVDSEARAREITEYRQRKRRETLGSAGSARTLEQMLQQIKDAGKKEFTLLVKGDVQGSVEAIVGALKKLGTDEVEARIVHSGVGGITESDVALAATSGSVIVGFNVRANVQAKQAADSQGVEIRYYSIIYDLVDDVKKAMSGLLAPTKREIFLGNAEILEVFNISKVGKVAGCRVRDGKVERGAKVRLLRDNVVIHEGTLSTLKRFKDEVKEVPAGQECGMAFANYQDIRQGDVIECFQVETVQRSL